MPRCALGSHLGAPPLPPAIIFWISKMGQPNEWFYISLGATEILENLSDGYEASSLSGRQLLR